MFLWNQPLRWWKPHRPGEWQKSFREHECAEVALTFILEVIKLTICPCCGNKLKGDLRDGCEACGARAVGPPLARPARELPSYGRALATGVAGAVLFLILVASAFLALFERRPAVIGLGSFVAAAETAAWRLKWALFPLSLLTMAASAWVRTTLRREPRRFAGPRLAYAGFALSAGVAISMLVLIGVTVPERLRQRELARQAAEDAQRHVVQRVLLEYRARYDSLPKEADDLRKLKDEDGVVDMVYGLLKSGQYTPEASLAALPPSTAKGRRRRTRAMRITPVSAKAIPDGAPVEAISFTNYELVLPGRDQLLNTADDIRIRDGERVAARSLDIPQSRPRAVSATSHSANAH